MTEPLHLTPDEIDLWLDGNLAPSRTSHLATCDECRTAAEETREVVMQLQALCGVRPATGFADRIIARLDTGAPAGLGNHFSDQELDDWLTDALASDRQAHLLACPDCRRLANQEKLLVLALGDLPLFDPAPGFPARVLARVDLPPTSLAGAWNQWRNRTFADPVAVGVASGLSVVLGGSLAASVAWAAGNQDLIVGNSQGVWHAAQQMFWLIVGAGTQRIASAPWYPALQALFSPARAILAAGGLALLYGAGVFAFRRLLALPEVQPARAAL
jgi:hypothetical protein